MLTAFLGLNIAVRLLTVQAIHQGYDISLVAADIHPSAYVHIDWKENPQTLVSGNTA